jgi:hypothetical protein
MYEITLKLIICRFGMDFSIVFLGVDAIFSLVRGFVGKLRELGFHKNLNPSSSSFPNIEVPPIAP